MEFRVLMQACSVLRCVCAQFDPNIFQKNICKNCYHVRSKHTGETLNVVERKTPIISSEVIETPGLQAPRIQNYPASLRTISEQFLTLSDEAETERKEQTNEVQSTEWKIESPRIPKKNLHVRENISISHSRQGSIDKSFVEGKPNCSNAGIDQTKQTQNKKKQGIEELGRVPVGRSITDKPKTEKINIKNDPVRQSTTFVLDLTPKLDGRNNNRALPPPPKSATLPPLPKQPTFVSTNTKRFGIRHQPNESYKELFKISDRASSNEVKLREIAQTLKLENSLKKRKRVRSSTIIESKICKKLSSTDPLQLSGNIENTKYKRRSSLPLGRKLSDLGVEVPPITLKILLYEPSKDVRSVSNDFLLCFLLFFLIFFFSSDFC